MKGSLYNAYCPIYNYRTDWIVDQNRLANTLTTHCQKGENHMSNKFEKRSGFEHVNIKTSQTRSKANRLIMYQSIIAFHRKVHYICLSQKKQQLNSLENSIMKSGK